MSPPLGILDTGNKMEFMFRVRTEAEFIDAVHTRQPIAGLTHGFYRYPARFSPLFVRAAIKEFTQPGDVVLDPFMGGGTTLVEARALGRKAIGTDINTLAVFVSRVKTTLMRDDDFLQMRRWANSLVGKLNLHNPPVRAAEWFEDGYQRNISSRSTWPIRKTIEFILSRIGELPNERQQSFVRCVLLRTAQWALDCRYEIPRAALFRDQFYQNLGVMVVGAKHFAEAVDRAGCSCSAEDACCTFCLHRSAVGIESDPVVTSQAAPRLILTSPPYPGVHVLYHRWQVNGRRETPAPFWIAQSRDGSGGSYYTFGDRKEENLDGYYEQLNSAFSSLARLMDKKSLVVQMVAFSEASWQLPRYLKGMTQAGLSEIKMTRLANSADGRLWRCVPNRKWYADWKGATPSSKEVVLFHRLV
jgi:hypothetical protein